MRERRLQQANGESAASQSAVARPLHHPAAPPPPHAMQPFAYPFYPPSAYPHQPPFAHPVYPPPMLQSAATPLPTALPASQPSAPPPQPAVDADPLSPTMIDDLLLLPEMQQYLVSLKESWSSKLDRGQRRVHSTRPKRGLKGTAIAAAAATDTIEEGREEEEEDEEKQEPADTRGGDDASQLLSACQSSLASATAEVSSLRAEQSAQAAQREVDRGTITVLEDRVRHLTSELDSSSRAHASSLSDASHRLSASESRASELESVRLPELQSAIDRLRADLASSKSHEQDLSRRLEQQKADAAAIDHQRASSAHLAEQHLGELRHARDQMRERDDALAIAEREKADLHDSVRRLTSEVDHLRVALSDALSSGTSRAHELEARMRDVARHHESELSESAAQIDHLRLSHDRLESTVADLQSRLRSQDAAAESRLSEEERRQQQQMQFIDQLHASLDTLAGDASAKQAENTALQTELKSLVRALDEVKSSHATQLAALRGQIDARNQDLHDCKVLLKTMMGEEKATRAQKTDLQRQVSHLTTQLAGANASLTRAAEERTHLLARAPDEAILTRMRELEHDLRISREIHSRLEHEKEELASRLDDAEDRACGDVATDRDCRPTDTDTDRNRGRSGAHQRAAPSADADECAVATPRVSVADEDLIHTRALQSCRDELAIKEKILDSLTSQLASEQQSLLSAQADLKSLRQSHADLERRAADLDDQRRSAHRELASAQHDLQAAQREQEEWSRLESENDDLRRTLSSEVASASASSRLLAKKQSSLAYVESELEAMKSLFDRKEADLRDQHRRDRQEHERDMAAARELASRHEQHAREETRRFQDAANRLHQAEHDLRILVVELEKERRQRKDIKEQLQRMI